MPFNNIASGYFTSTTFKDLQKADARHMAGIYMSLPFMISAVLIPFFGKKRYHIF